jgi:hypothetical protein
MKKTVIPFLALLIFLVFTGPAPAQFYPDPVDLDIKNEEQKIEEWFWPALIRQVLLKHGPQSPSQCQIMSLALADQGGLAPNPDCCLSLEQNQNPDQNQESNQDPDPDQKQDICKRPLDHTAAIKIIEQFGLKAEVVPKPANADQIYEYLSNGRALLVGFRIAKDKRHAYLVRGISWTEEGQPMLKINDPHVIEPFQASFAEEARGWQTVIAIQ